MVWGKTYDDKSIIMKVDCDCGCQSSDIWLHVEKDEYGYWMLNIGIEEIHAYVFSDYHPWRIVEFAKNFWNRFKAASKIMWYGKVTYKHSTMIGDCNIDDLYKAISIARKQIKQK